MYIHLNPGVSSTVSSTEIAKNSSIERVVKSKESKGIQGKILVLLLYYINTCIYRSFIDS